GLDTADSAAWGSGRLLFESARFDRWEMENGTLRRIHQEDFCQATGHRSAQKYQARGGPAYADIVHVIRRHTANPLRDIDVLASWVLFNLLVGNNDAHAKNLALLYTPDGLQLAPVYDVVSTHVYPHLDRQFSIEVGGQRTPEALHRTALDKFARSLGMKPAAVARLGEPLIDRARGQVASVFGQVASQHAHAPVLDQIHDLILERAVLLENWLAAGLGPRP
ncbi:MAG TPA: HipA domain-containing protein, partial [Longimicrobium sp.]|nr:HipA domain-containing protein [Longimicrobium sp.]